MDRDGDGRISPAERDEFFQPPGSSDRRALAGSRLYGSPLSLKRPAAKWAALTQTSCSALAMLAAEIVLDDTNFQQARTGPGTHRPRRDGRVVQRVDLVHGCNE